MDTTCDLSGTKYFNDNGVRWGFTFAKGPSWERHDCGVTALAVAADIPYKLAHELLKSWGRQDKEYTPNWTKFLAKGPFKWKGGRIYPVTIRRFCQTNRGGRYAVLLRPRSYTCHLAAVVDGVFYNGNVDGLQCRITHAWRFNGIRKEVL